MKDNEIRDKKCERACGQNNDRADSRLEWDWEVGDKEQNLVSERLSVV